MKILNCEQGSLEWFEARAGIPTASEFSCLVTPLWKIRTGGMPLSLATWVTGDRSIWLASSPNLDR